MGALDGRIAVITGGGRGLGRSHARLLAAEGARVVVNDLGEPSEGGGDSPARSVAEEVVADGGQAVASEHDVVSWEGGRALIETALEAFGGLDVLVNNAGTLADRALVNMSEQDWDRVVGVNLKGHFVPTRFAAQYWRAEEKAGRGRRANVVNTSSTSGLIGNPGQTNYGAAKAGVAAFSIICAQELSRYGVRTNCIAPAARTRLTESTPGLSEMVAAPPDPGQFDVWDPANVSPLVAVLAAADCPFNGRTFFVQGGTIRRFEPWQLTETIEREERWEVDALRSALEEWVSEGRM